MPERSCETCKHYRPYTGSQSLRESYAKCVSPRKPATVVFVDTVRGIPDLCGPKGAWWERRKPVFEIVEDDAPRSTVRRLDWDDDPDEDDDL